MWQI
jgi:hypothetical protein